GHVVGAPPGTGGGARPARQRLAGGPADEDLPRRYLHEPRARRDRPVRRVPERAVPVLSIGGVLERTRVDASDAEAGRAVRIEGEGSARVIVDGELVEEIGAGGHEGSFERVVRIRDTS